MASGYLIGVLPGVALALAADAVASVVAQGGGRVVGTAAGLEVTVEAEVICVTLASPPEKVSCTLADPAHVGPVSRALWSIFNVSLRKGSGQTFRKVYVKLIDL